MYVYMHFYALCLMFDDCTFLLDCFESENVIDKRHKKRSINKPTINDLKKKTE